MRAAFCPKPGKIELREVETPAPGTGDAVVRVEACGICGSDLHWYSGAGRPPETCPGHEFIGWISALGSAAGAMREGDRVAVEPMRSCGNCVRCREGDYHLCSGLVIFGLQEAGGLAENVLVPIGGLYPLPAELMSPVAALSEPMAVCVHAVRLAPVRVGDRVLVLGAGSIGLLSIVAARAAGAAEVWITARYPHQAEAARLLGATRVFGSGADDVSALAVAAAEEPPDVVLETVGGTAETLNTGVHAVRPGGTVVVLGLFMQRTALDALILMAKEVRVVGSMVYNRRDGKADFEIALDLLAARQHALHPLVTHDFDLEATQRAFDTAADKKTGAIKVIIRP